MPAPPAILLELVVLQAAYLLAVGPWRHRFRKSRPVATWKIVAFSQGVLLMAIALASPLDTISDYDLFSAHMLQHLLLILGVAPLLLVGLPDWLLESVLRSLGLLPVARFLLKPVPAFLLFNVVFSLSHIPSIYDLTLASKPLHDAEHLLYVFTAIVMWMPVLSPAPRLLPRYPPLAQVLYLFFQTIPAGVTGALISQAPAPFYTPYILAPRITALSPMEDQQLGGLLMWVGGDFYFLLASTIVFFRWAGREEAANRRPEPVNPSLEVLREQASRA